MDHVTEALLGVLAVAFAAWAGVVWRASVAALALSKEVSLRVELQIEDVERRTKRLEERLDSHESQRGHEGAMADMEAMHREVTIIRDDLRDIRSTLSGVTRKVTNRQ